MTNAWGYKVITPGTIIIMIKDPFLGQDKIIVSNVAEYEKSIDLISDSTLQISFKKIPLAFPKCVFV